MLKIHQRVHIKYLNQTYRNFELIIVDDFSKDDSSKIISEFSDERIKFFKSKNKLGRTKALNFGLKSVHQFYSNSRC